MKNTLRVTPAGELDMATADSLLDSVREALIEKPSEIVLDLEAVTFCDSSGIGALLDAREIAAAAGVPLYVTGPGPVIHRSLEITGVLSLLAPA